MGFILGLLAGFVAGYAFRARRGRLGLEKDAALLDKIKADLSDVLKKGENWGASEYRLFIAWLHQIRLRG